MKKSILFAAFVLVSISCFSQDLMSFKRGETKLEVIVTEITPTLVRYKLFSDPNQRIYFVYKEDVAEIRYKDGRVVNFSQSGEQVIVNNNENQNQQQSSVTVTQVTSQPVTPQPTTSQPATNWNQTNAYTSQSAGRGEDVVYLRNGGVIRGSIIEQLPNEYIKIQTANGNITVYTINEVERILRDNSSTRNIYQLPRSSSGTGLRRGFRAIIDFGYYWGDDLGDYRRDRFIFNFIAGYQATPYFSFGLGTGFAYYDGVQGYSNAFSGDEFLIPFFTDFRVNFINRRVSPYLSFDIGYSFKLDDDFKGVGMFINPTIGVSFRAVKRSEIHIGIGYHLQNWKDAYWNYYTNNYKNVDFEAIAFKFGFSF